MAEEITIEKSDRPGEIDYAQIIFAQILKTVNSFADGDIEVIARNVKTLMDLVDPYEDAEYKKELREIRKNYDEKIEMLKKHNPPLKEEDITRETLENSMVANHMIFRQIIRLIHRSGFLPYKYFEEVWD